MEVILMAYPKQFLFGANESFWFRTQNVTSCLTTLDQLEGLFYNFAQWKGPRGTWQLYQWFFWKKSYCIQSNLFILEQKWCGVGDLFTLICSQVFSSILLKKRDQEVHEKFFSCFLRKNLIWGNLIFSSHFLMFDGGVVKIASGHCYYWIFKSQDMIKIL